MHRDVWLLPDHVHSRCSLLHMPSHHPNASYFGRYVKTPDRNDYIKKYYSRFANFSTRFGTCPNSNIFIACYIHLFKQENELQEGYGIVIQIYAIPVLFYSYNINIFGVTLSFRCDSSYSLDSYFTSINNILFRSIY